MLEQALTDNGVVPAQQKTASSEQPILAVCKDNRYEMTMEQNFGISMVDEKYNIVAFERGKTPAGQSFEVEIVI